MLPRDSKTRNVTFWVEETSQIMLTAFSLLAANKSTIIKMLSKWFEIFLTLSKYHISCVDYPGQRIYHLLECLSSRKLKDIYKYYLINPYMKTCRENRKKKQRCHVQLPNEGSAQDTKRLQDAEVSGHFRPKASGSVRTWGLYGGISSQWGGGGLGSTFHFLKFLPFIGTTHLMRSYCISGKNSFTEHLLWVRPSV